MFSAIAWIASLLLGLGGGATTGINNPDPADQRFNNVQCYNPSPSETVTLTWPDNFVNLTDKRITLNPHIFGSYKTIFNTTSECRSTLFTGTDGKEPPSGTLTRTYIKVRDHLRVSSCKTDELTGPYAGPGMCPGWDEPGKKKSPTEIRQRGTCEDKIYPELRKVAEISQGGELREIFWTPYSHDVACNFDPSDPNCGWKKPEYNKNLREFIYVLTSREAFDPSDPRKGCQVLWDAGSTNKDACSHYFDVYMAEDLWEKTQQDISESDPDYETYKFIKDVVENCQENSTFTPIVDVPGIRVPPQFIELPFVSQDFFTPRNEKITPYTPAEYAAYERFILNSESINPGKTHLIELHPPTKTGLAECGTTADAECYIPLGGITIPFSGQSKLFRVYTRANTPQTFYFQPVPLTDGLVYFYTITVDVPPWRNEHDPTLQLSHLRFSASNEWTWATPQCKPAIYLYPEKPSTFQITLTIDGEMTTSDPLYDPSHGWNVIAHPDGKIFPLVNQDNAKPYPYLYYEANVQGIDLPKEGWIVEKEKIQMKIEKILTEIGFSEKERKDFLEYWLPRLKEKPYYAIMLLPEDLIHKKEHLTISTVDHKQPDTLIRARVIFEGLDAPKNISPPSIPRHERKGFVVTDWGGSIVGKSCTDISVQ